MKPEISAPQLMSGVEMKVRIRWARVAKARIWLGAKLIRLGAAVMGVGKFTLEWDKAPEAKP